MFAGNKALQSGYALGAHNAANQGAAGYAAQENSPQAMAGAWSGYQNAAQGIAPNYGSMNQLGSSVYGAPQVPVGQGLGSILGSLVGPVMAGGGLGSLASLLRGSGGGGGGYNGNGPGTIPVINQGNQNMMPWAGFQGFG